MKAKRKEPVEREVETIWNPRVIADQSFVRFEYEPGNYFELQLQKDGGLMIRCSGQHSDLLAIHCHVANSTIVRARRWSSDLMRHDDFYKARFDAEQPAKQAKREEP